MNVISTIIRLIFYPLKAVTRLIYGRDAAKIMGYSWYSRSEFEKIKKTAKDRKEMLTYREWKEQAEETVSS